MGSEADYSRIPPPASLYYTPRLSLNSPEYLNRPQNPTKTYNFWLLVGLNSQKIKKYFGGPYRNLIKGEPRGWSRSGDGKPTNYLDFVEGMVSWNMAPSV